MKVLYISIPKTGSTSVRTLAPRLFKYKMYGQDGKKRLKSPIKNNVNFVDFHTHSCDWVTYWPIANYNYDIKFATVRNPFDKIYSGFMYCIRKEHKGRYSKLLTLDSLSFEDFIMNYEKYISFMPKAEFNHILKRHIDFPIGNCNLYIKLENINDGWKKLCNIADVEYVKLPIKNVNKHADYKNIWTKKMIDHIKPYLYQDFEYLEYKYSLT